MHILVAGGTGFIGRQVVAAALARGDEVTVVGRGPAEVLGARVMPWAGLRLAQRGWVFPRS